MPATFEIILNKLGHRNSKKFQYLLTVFKNKFQAEISEEIDYGPYKEPKGFYYYGKEIKGLLLKINKKYFHEIADNYFNDKIVVWNLFDLEIYFKGDWNIYLIKKYKNKIYFEYLIVQEKYKLLFSNFDNVVQINNEKVWVFFLRNPELYNFKDIISYKELFTSYIIRELNYNAIFELNDIIENQDIILKDSFSLNPCATKFFFELIHFDNLISPARLSLNKAINESFLIKFFEYYLENQKKLEEFDILYAIQNCNFNPDADLCEIFKNIIDMKPILLPVFLNKTANLESYKKNFRRLNNENVFKSFNLNFVWDVELFEMLLLLLNPKRLNNYRFFSNVLDKILISKDILTKYGNVLNGGFTYEKKIYSSWSEGSIYRDLTIDFPSMIIEHPDLSRDEINDFLNSHHYIKY